MLIASESSSWYFFLPMGSCFSYSPGTYYSRVKFMSSFSQQLIYIQVLWTIRSTFMYSAGTLFTGLYFHDSSGTLYSKEEQVYISRFSRYSLQEGRTGFYFSILQVFFTARKNRFIFLDSLGTLYSKEEQAYIFLIFHALFTVRKNKFIFFRFSRYSLQYFWFSRYSLR